MAVYAKYKTHGQYLVEKDCVFSSTPDIESATDLSLYGDDANFIINLLRSFEDIFEIVEV